MTERELTLLTEGDVELVGQIVRSSNETFLVKLTLGDDTAQAVYKPLAGERPLSDFPPGLHKRERAAYVLSESLGWGMVPPTVIREDAPLGEGSLQWFIDCDFREHYFTLAAEDTSTHADMARMALFDYIANNTDRKSGHVLRGADGRIWGIDHGLCFSAIFKLRTVIWDFAGEAIPEDLLSDIAPLADKVPADLAELLDDDECAALKRRVSRIMQDGTLPVDLTGMRYPWPLV
ncbi:Phosphatidylinositol 3- and 4-kinase [Arthrobacter ulcerisalmonis]|uniref:Phosphatidylinositol 3- and 4-kinase n=1 Tax=Arthrobacter ulcerisalmonis TaxID=2483813 RepID=A0A3P5WQT7_9MICC|nr:SCO1664 family protein [Arthrobacter ulcerisalmonis]VDC20986.1 Phosphatidylinositol 3- and 4-kinase [Arthrobacter ulcerisalmonis]